MKSLSFSLIVLASFATLFSVADARRFYVGGNGAWVINPHESYNTWAERNRFQVNDTLYFKYAKGSDSVQRVMKADFDGCNIMNPLEKFDNGEAEVTLNRSGPFYFISGNQEHCMKGQKLIVVVLAVRHQKVPISPAKAPSTAQPPKAHSPVSPPAKAPSTTQPPKSHTPVSPVAPAKAPSTVQPPKSHSPVSPVPPVTPPSTSQPPKSSVSPSQPSTPSSPAVSPSHAPTISPATHSPPSKSPSPASSPSSSTSSPAKPPTSSPSPDDSSPTSSDSTPTADNIKAPAPSPKNAASGVAVTSVLTRVLSVAFTVLMFA